MPRKLIALVANRVYHENYVCRRMQSARSSPEHELTTGDTVAYSWRSIRRSRLSAHPSADQPWNTLAARVAAPLEIPRPNSLAAFLVEHYWGYARGRDGRTREYRIAHDPWRVAAADEVTWSCDVAANFNSPLAHYLTAAPTSAFIADGTPVAVFPGLAV